MSKEAPIIAEKIELFHIDIIKSEIKEGDKSSEPNYDLEVAHKTSHNLKDERIRIKLLIHLFNRAKVVRANEGKFEIDFHYKIGNLDNFYSFIEESGAPIISGNLIATLLGISFSTARGMLYERLANTNLQGVILPVVSPRRMLDTKV